MRILCAVCDGCGQVVWSDRIPRAPKEGETPDGDCPACDGNGVEYSPEDFEDSVVDT